MSVAVHVLMICVIKKDAKGHVGDRPGAKRSVKIFLPEKPKMVKPQKTHFSFGFMSLLSDWFKRRSERYVKLSAASAL